MRRSGARRRDDPAVTGEIPMMSDPVIAEPSQERRQGVGLVVAMFQQQSSAGFQPIPGISGDGAEGIQALGSGFQGEFRFEPHVPQAEMNVMVGDIRRIAGDEIETRRLGQGGEPIAQREADSCRAVPCRVLAGYGQGFRAEVGGDDPGEWPFGGEGDGDDPAAGAEIEDFGGPIFRNEFQRQLDEELGLRAGDQHAGPADERPRPELPFAGEIGHRPAIPPAFHQGLEAVQLVGTEQLFRPGAKIGPVAAQHMPQQHFGIEAGGVAAVGQPQGGSLQGSSEADRGPGGGVKR